MKKDRSEKLYRLIGERLFNYDACEAETRAKHSHEQLGALNIA